jgi:alpha-beta hydrolase superfamily lysophospholipase
VVHGLGEHSGRYQALAVAMAEQGISTYAVDLRGMGSSGGGRGRLRSWQEWVDDYSVFFRMVSTEVSGEVVPLGHSFGGVVALSALIRGAIKADRLVLSNPAIRPAVNVPAWKARLGVLSSRLLPGLVLTNQVDPGVLSRDPAVVRAYREDPLVHDRISSRLYTEWLEARQEAIDRAGSIEIPVLLICSAADRLIDPAGSRELAARLPRAELKIYADRYHEPFNDLGANEVFRDLAAWLLAPARYPEN